MSLVFVGDISTITEIIYQQTSHWGAPPCREFPKTWLIGESGVTMTQCWGKIGGHCTEIPLEMVGTRWYKVVPPKLCLLVYNPTKTVDITNKNHSYWSYVHQLNALPNGGTTLHLVMTNVAN